MGKPSTVPDDDLTDYQYFFGDTQLQATQAGPVPTSQGNSSSNSGQHSSSACYLAPERCAFIQLLLSTLFFLNCNQNIGRFVNPSSIEATNLTLTPAMDIFSLGCVIAEVGANLILSYTIYLIFGFNIHFAPIELSMSIVLFNASDIPRWRAVNGFTFHATIRFHW